jgi:RNA polymerase sigma factor (TIGR02999 family)
MSDLTDLLSAASQGDARAAEELLPLVYEELRKLARHWLLREPGTQTLQPTALVHEAYLRLVGSENGKPWNGRGHFFGACAEAMRRILVEGARRRMREKHGGGRRRVDLDEESLAAPSRDEKLLALDEALAHFEKVDPLGARLVRLRFFAGRTMPEAAEDLGIPLRTAEREWAHARAWLHRALEDGSARS